MNRMRTALHNRASALVNSSTPSLPYSLHKICASWNGWTQSLSSQWTNTFDWFGLPSLSSNVVNLILTRECLANRAVETQRRQVANNSSVSASISDSSETMGTENKLTGSYHQWSLQLLAMKQLYEVYIEGWLQCCVNNKQWLVTQTGRCLEVHGWKIHIQSWQLQWIWLSKPGTDQSPWARRDNQTVASVTENIQYNWRYMDSRGWKSHMQGTQNDCWLHKLAQLWNLQRTKIRNAIPGSIYDSPPWQSWLSAFVVNMTTSRM